jgi:hypothetical protein
MNNLYIFRDRDLIGLNVYVLAIAVVCLVVGAVYLFSTDPINGQRHVSPPCVTLLSMGCLLMVAPVLNYLWAMTFHRF